MLTSVAVTEPFWETVNGKKAVAPTPSVPSNVSVVVGAVDVVVVVSVEVVGDVVLCLQPVASNTATATERNRTRMSNLRNAKRSQRTRGDFLAVPSRQMSNPD